MRQEVWKFARVALVVCAMAARLPAMAEAPGCVAFVDVSVVMVDEGRVQPHTTVVVAGERIREVGAVGAVALPKGCAVVDGWDRFLMPGLTDSHVHFFGFRQLGKDDRATERAVLAMLLANGVTTAMVMEGTPEVLRLRKAIADGEMIGPRIHSAGALIQMTGSGVPQGRTPFDTPEQVRREVMAEKAAGYDFIKVHGDLPPKTYAALLATAREQGIPVIGHVPNNLGIEVTLAGGQKMITHAESYLDGYFRFHREMPTAVDEQERMVREIAVKTKQAGVWVQPTLSVFRQISWQVADIDAVLQRPEMRYMPKVAVGDWRPEENPYVQRWTVKDIVRFRAQYGLMQRLVKGLADAGVPLLAGTDDMVPSQLPGFSMRDELEELNEAGLTPTQVIQTATTNAARFVGAGDEGAVAEGKVANLLLLSANPLEGINNVWLQDGLVLRGRWFAEAELRARLERMAEAKAGVVSGPAGSVR